MSITMAVCASVATPTETMQIGWQKISESARSVSSPPPPPGRPLGGGSGGGKRTQQTRARLRKARQQFVANAPK